jgi:hypothetical protein
VNSGESIIMDENISDAVYDLRFLLSRGYNRKNSVSMVGDKYQLGKTERHILYRAVYDEETAERHKDKKVSVAEIEGKRLGIDGYNVVITVESMLSEKKLLLCDDGFVRDVSGVYGKHKPTSLTKTALDIIVQMVQAHSPFQVGFFYDSQVSLSGELASLTRSKLQNSSVSGKAEAVKNSDISTLRYGDVVSSSDRVLIEKADILVDLAGEIIKKHSPDKIIDIAKI